MEDKAIMEKIVALPAPQKQKVIGYIDMLLKQKENTSKPTFGSCKGVFKMSDDFNEPLEDFKEYMP